MKHLKVIAAAIIIAGQLIAVTPSSAQSYTYDEYGRLKVVTYSANVKTGYTYDKSDNRTNVQTTTNGVLNNPPVCDNWIIELSGIPQNTVTIHPNVENFTDHCSDADGQALSLVSPANRQVTINRTETKYVPFTVSDGNGGTGSALLTVTWP